MYGQHTRAIDDKNRVVLPAAYKDQLGTSFFITLGFDKNFELRSVENFNAYTKKLQNKSQFNSKVRHLTRIIMSNVVEVNLDKQGRISLPKFIIDKLSIQKEVVFVGNGSIIELWSKEAFQEFENLFQDGDLAKLAEEISKMEDNE
ncbi:MULTISPECIES: division/cell wall cluster transcriptional repressor MraZ [unclassified Mycoplasma]|uniref:division/cell wall cluster transcriptional repressor MraZ n=1 Tax=unclassified Mycoplasma TaxID=2683645 RepID=UPI00211C65C9|nr:MULTISPECIES: division/cell wall cluster transcriptional repressor MraZ [unclassified Mycoplasma]UUM20125.1 division/cell wall cluster transcriptional repressor MraZ [Mycoplasma sp. 1578d]UUM25105.1 division/cell wall cluster transcriptional repressor MraZ [Mycoplasma sp. 3686d]